MLDWFFAPTGPFYTRGDADASGGKPNVVDGSYVLSHLLPNPVFPCLRSADADANQSVNIVDASYILSHILPDPSFPPPNWPDTCQNVPSDTLPCDSFPPCGWPTKVKGGVMNGSEEEGAVVRFGEVEKVGEWYEIPVIVESGEAFAAYQVEIRYRGRGEVEVTDEGTVSEGFDIFETYAENGEIKVVGLKEFAVSENGIAKGYLEAGEYEVARIRVKELAGMEFEYAVLADIYGRDIYPRLSVGVGAVSYTHLTLPTKA
mgnify:FL=1